VFMLPVLIATTSLLLRPPAVPLYRTPTPARLSPRMATEELVEQFVDWLESGPGKVFRTSSALEGDAANVLVPMRVLAGVLMIHHGSEGGLLPANFGTEGFDGFVTYVLTPYFGFLPGSPDSLPLWAALHDYVEFFGGFLVAVGLLTRAASFALFTTMLAAVYFHFASTGLQGFPLGHVENYSYNFEEPALYAAIFLFFSVVGAGPLSVDDKIYSKIVEGLDGEQ